MRRRWRRLISKRRGRPRGTELPQAPRSPLMRCQYELSSSHRACVPAGTQFTKAPRGEPPRQRRTALKILSAYDEEGVDLDGSGEGLNDPAPVEPIAGPLHD